MKFLQTIELLSLGVVSLVAVKERDMFKFLKPKNGAVYHVWAWGILAFASQLCSPGCAATYPENLKVSVTQNDLRRVALQWNPVGNATQYRLVVDDDEGFENPLVVQNVTGTTSALEPLSRGLAAGTLYHVRIEPGEQQGKFRLRGATLSYPVSKTQFLDQAWKITGRAWLDTYAGVTWNQDSRTYTLRKPWSGQDTAGATAYFVGYATQAGVSAALNHGDLELANELAQFHLTYAGRFTTLGVMRQQRHKQLTLLEGQGPDSTRTLPWSDGAGTKMRSRENILGNSQFFYPASRLMRLISTLPLNTRTSAEQRYVALYAPLLIKEHLIRLCYEAKWSYWNDKSLPPSLIDIWQTLAESRAPAKLSYQRAMLDSDLWLIATAAEVLGANANDAALVPLTPSEKSKLRRIVSVGTKLFQSKRELYPNTRNRAGKVVGSASYFNGDFDDHPTMAHSFYEDSKLPRATQKKSKLGASWDIGHFYRVPIFLRALYDNRVATGLEFPTVSDIRLVCNQMAFRVFRGDMKRPLFNNFFDGSNGWYRVGYHGSGFGYPPAQFADMRISSRPSLAPGAIYGWGQVAFVSPDLTQIQQSLVQMAASSDPAVVEFRKRYYTFKSEEFSFKNAAGRWQSPMLLYILLAEQAE
ncbi:MAG TPA: hypothetical protein VF681_15700 [Abditibacteriaceae bacterium]